MNFLDLSRKNKTKISPGMVRYENDVHNSSKIIFISYKKNPFVSLFTNGANRPGMNHPVQKMVLEWTVPGGPGFGANRPVTHPPTNSSIHMVQSTF